jgi:CRP-like cAMP-binding protein
MVADLLHRAVTIRFATLIQSGQFPRQATVTATTDVLLFRIAKEPFIEVLTGYASALAAAEEVIIGYSKVEGTE